jgi:nitrous oxide reductase accessory protein NosL
MRASVQPAAACLLLSWLPACGGRGLEGPPELRAGRDECAECGMIVTDDRACAAVLVEIDGHHEHRLFDDLGCLIDFQNESRDGRRVLEGWVVDHADGGWLPLKEAHYLLADTGRLMTPMGSGYVAYADLAAARGASAQFGGSVGSFDDLSAARRAWRASLHSGSTHKEPDHDD